MESRDFQETAAPQVALAQSLPWRVQTLPLLSRTVRRFSGIGSPLLSIGTSLITGSLGQRQRACRFRRLSVVDHWNGLAVGRDGLRQAVGVQVERAHADLP
jgi:hypothetical protein